MKGKFRIISLLTFSLLCFFSLISQAQDDKFSKAMQKNLKALDSAKTTAEYIAVSNSFERIGDAEKTSWLPYYYAALALITPAWEDKTINADANSVKVKALIEKASKIEDNVEIYALRNMIATQQMLIEPSIRWANYGVEASTALKKGLAMDPENPRLNYLKGSSIFYTPTQFGGGKDKAKPVLQKAVELYSKEQPKPLYPAWGKEIAASLLAQCN
ncbi:MAG: hypothetical protein J7604_18145 [Sporocytophaga sp.]|uniref:hypothetical protein n=1 Tax=Sporocytophaga sp. TaxID=2231183 RepID=UPI001B1CB9CC|nr:hypothetical protein [Sporocytophaga sp.]MBO9702136.1 hypothetical protein [Sporocytophaga sp.]